MILPTPLVSDANDTAQHCSLFSDQQRSLINNLVDEDLMEVSSKYTRVVGRYSSFLAAHVTIKKLD
jgi:hypothetical protein